MKKYKLVIDVAALEDIQNITDWYNQQSPGLGKRFQSQVKTNIKVLRTEAKNFGIRYANVRCVLVKPKPRNALGNRKFEF